MDPNAVKSTLSNLAFGNVMAAAARDYQKELLAQEKAPASTSINQEVDLDELMDDPELEKLHADRIAALKKEAEKREILKKQGCGEYREITEGDFLGEVTGSEKVICHFYHREFYRCKIMDKHLKLLAVKYIDTKFIKLDAESCGGIEVGFVESCGGRDQEEGQNGGDGGYGFDGCVSEMVVSMAAVLRERGNAPFFVAKLAIKTLPCVILFRNGIGTDRLVGFQDLGGKDDFTTKTLETLFIRKGIINEIKGDEEDEDDHENKRRTVRSSVEINSDSD
ncbi:thioredoxin domain PLP3A-like protein [Actinidia rufa]|uniref:Thioredoxin domain PLP3A-like protein n=1 Tax=Actinidia rufa TaxID=165716 RepID=A0A7J0FNR8_9ERIC|nr:thioredoxin domain PLP3A-like protein [Actinidia rufa]